MGVVYKNNPIVEAICAFDFTDSTEWDSTNTGLLYNRISTKYPQKSDNVNFNFLIKKNGPELFPVFPRA